MAHRKDKYIEKRVRELFSSVPTVGRTIECPSKPANVDGRPRPVKMLRSENWNLTLPRQQNQD
jgi:hypothetical protein